MPEFPEVRSFGRFQSRERLFRNQLSPSLLTLTDSKVLAERLAHRYGVDHERLLPMDFSPAATLSLPELPPAEHVLKKHALQPGYFFYPAQFWAHKNHIRILEALVQLNSEGLRFNVTFSGSNQGNRAHIEHFVQRNGLEHQVRFLDFVPAADMPGLYQGCLAVVMPTYFGPTNLPPLEAWTFDKPLVYSRLFADQVRDAAILIDPDSTDELASAMKECTDTLICANLIENGRQRLKEIERDREESEHHLLARLLQFEKRLRCWN
jgi:glycosyltransferase involved in cell wall biosynthesis